MAIIKEYFHPNRIALMRELEHHPEICALVAKYPPQEFELRLAEIAAAVSVVLDGDYMPEDLDNLCGILVKKLYEKRSGILLN